MKRRYKLSRALVAVIVTVYLSLSLAVFYLVRSYERSEALESARSSAELMIERNLSIHRYFAKELKPSVFALAGERLPEGYFDARWMSSTHALRVMQGYLEKSKTAGFYYKECAIDARSPENEADPFERDFLESSAKDPGMTGWSGVRDIEGKPYYVVLQRGESMEEDCLLCHSDPLRAPKGLVERFGDKRSFGRTAGELVSALSVRVPLATAYAQAEGRSRRLVVSISGALAISLLLLYFLGREYLYKPLRALRDAVSAAETDEARLGLPIETGGSREVQEVADAFAGMSARVKEHLVGLEMEVQRRTQHLEEAREKLIEELAERGRMASALADSDQRYRNLFANMTEAFALHELILDEDGKATDYRFLDINPAFEKETGLSRANVVGNTQRALLPDEDPFWLRTYATVAFTGEPVHLEHYSSSLGRYYEVNAFRPEAKTFAVLFRDVTGQKALEQQLRQAQKMEAIGTLAGGIAHDFNNILTPIMAHGELALMQLPSGDPVREDIGALLSSVERAASLVRQILTISRNDPTALPVPVNLGALVTEATQFLRASIPATIEIRTEVDPTCGLVLAEPTQLHQVLLNLCTNASYAMADSGGVLTISVGREEQKGREGHPSPSRRLRLTVSDTGPGIPERVKDRIFEPYFTTKPVGKGSGLGLAVVHGIVANLGGDIAVTSEPGRGATFEVLLPEIERGRDLPRVAMPPVSRGSGQHVLAVDDEPSIGKILERLLPSLGYRVTVCGSGIEALAVLQADPTTFDAVITDYTMPRMTGVNLAREMLKIRPELPILLATGIAEGMDRETVKAEGLRELIPKPYTREALSAALESLFGCSHPPPGDVPQ